MSNDTDSYEYLDDETLQTILAQHRQNLSILMLQSAQSGTIVPLSVVNQIENTLKAMKDISILLSSHNAVILDEQEAKIIEKQAHSIVNNYYANNYADNSQNITAKNGSKIDKARQVHEGSVSGSQNITASASEISNVEQIKRESSRECYSCHQLVPPTQKFCGNCGIRVN